MPRHTNRPVRLYQTLIEDTERVDDPKYLRPTHKDGWHERRDELYDQYMLLSTVQLRALCKRLNLKVSLSYGRGAKARFALALANHKMGVRD